MNSTEFINAAISISNKKTVYGWGCFGQKATDAFIDQKAKQYPSWYTTSKIKELKALADDTLMVDCVGLIKMILWGYPTVKYTSNNVPDITADMMIKKCTTQSTNFNNIVPGEVVHMSGHIGIYIGSGNVIESTPKWNNGVQLRKLSDRVWTSHGKLPYVTYSEPVPQTNAEERRYQAKYTALKEELEKILQKY